MLKMKCVNCGASDFSKFSGYFFCAYCDSQFVPEKKEILQKETTISISGDIQNLLMKMKLEPANAKRYAQLIWDIDPNNIEVKKYL